MRFFLLLLLLAGVAWAETPRIPTGDLETLIQSGKVIMLDVREPAELEEFGSPPGALNIPIGELEDRLEEVPRDKPILTA